MKKLFVLIFTFCLLLGLCACAEAGTETENAVSFTFTVTHDDGREKAFELTAEPGQTLADVLVGEGLAEESVSAGLYDIFDGEKADWSDGEAWWNLMGNGESLAVGINDIIPKEGDAFAAVFTRGFSE